MRFTGKIVALLMVVCLIVGAAGSYAAINVFDLGQSSESEIHLSDEDGESFDLQKVEAAADVISEKYFQKVDKKDLYNGAIRGMIESLDDPFSTYMDSKEAKQFSQQLSSSFSGIGVKVQMINGAMTIMTTMEGTPADKAGLRPQDQIVTVNGDSIKGMSLYKAISKIKGKNGTTVELGIKRKGVSEPINFDIDRGKIKVETVKSRVITKEKEPIGYIEITSFNENTDEAFKEHLQQLESQDIKGLLIDVRSNPGGYLESVLNIGNILLPKGSTIVKTQDRAGQTQSYKVESGEGKSYPMALLINKGSASASEILAGALKEAGGYPVIGTQSFGKGTVQTLAAQFKDSSEIKLTVRKWLTPKGHWIHEKGIEPTNKFKQSAMYYTHPTSIKEGKVLGYDDTNDKVSNIQKMLKGLGYSPGRTDGYYSKDTADAVRAFQKVNDLEVNGSVDQKTASKLEMKVLNAIDQPENDMQLQQGVNTLLDKINQG
ncbi:S41 family peptidase [Tuberibacillus sp. Marseille-P3662]|uniref:S41 family peptidase n=1 Tax=Tuberibacillus sp. Marseille-P3662 TaxID=1965358 RepID=UPI00111C865F|nr:S41 family peptidase [Tuberibacillus sp. Marseille-P3662]